VALYKAYRRVVSNKGSCGVDGMEVDDLKEFLSTYQSDLVRDVLEDSYLPNAIRGVEIPKPNGKKRLLGIPSASAE
jgi:retron-type reverse transcriptase